MVYTFSEALIEKKVHVCTSLFINSIAKPVNKEVAHRLIICMK